MTAPLQPLALFISYSHKDDAWRAKLDSHLALLKRQQVFDVWHDRRIGAGQEWAGQIDDALERASVVLLLVSSDFLASDYCYDKEMKRALQRHDEHSARVVPVILRKCDWQSSDFGRLQAVPRDGRPIAGHPDVDEAMTEVALALRQVAQEIRGQPAALPTLPNTLGMATNLPATDLGSAQAPQGLVAEAVAQQDATAAGNVAGKPPWQAQSNPQPAPVRKLKIGAVKFGPFEIGPFELEWPARLRPAWAACVFAAGLAAIGAVVYALLVKPPLDEARNQMRRAEYSGAAKALDALPPWAKGLPAAAALAAQAAFGARLARGEHIASLAPALESLARLYPQDPDVQVFLGLKAYYADAKLMPAIQRFTQAADQDKAHVEAHFLAAGRYIELAYLALAQADEPRARAAALEARKWIDRAVERSPFAATLPHYASQMAELDELEGDARAAHTVYARLAPQHTLSAVQAAMLSWQLPPTTPAIRNGLESLESAIQRIDKETPDSVAVEGWSFRVSATDLIPVHPKNEKLCLLEWVQAISAALLQTQDVGRAPASPSTNSAPPHCGSGALAQRIVEVVCVAAVTARDRLPPEDRRKAVLEDWRATQLSCASGLQAVPTLASPAGTAKVTALRTAPGADRELEPS